MRIELSSESTSDTYLSLCELLDKYKKLYYSRFGDGDIFIMMGKNQANHDFHPDLQKEMIESFKIESTQYLKGLAVNYPNEKGMYRGFMSPYMKNNEMENFLIKTFNFQSDQTFKNAWFIHYFSIYKPKLMNEFLDKYIRPKTKLFIGNIPKPEIEKLVGNIDYYVHVPARNSYWTIDEWWPKVLNNIDKVQLVLPAAGMSTRIINKRLWKMNKEIHSIDLGSIVDAVISKKTRRWIRIRGHRINNILLPAYQRKGFFYKILYIYKEICFYFSSWHYMIKHRY